MKNIRPQMPCPRCEGYGKIPMPLELIKTIEAINRLGGAATPKQVYQYTKNGRTQSATNGRLQRLFKAGILERNEESGELIYSLKIQHE